MVKITRALPFQMIIMITLLVPAIALHSPGGDRIEDRSEGDLLTIDLGSPVFDIARSFMDGREWSTIEMKDALYPPTNGEPSMPVFSHPLELRNEVTDIQLVRSDPVTIPLPKWIPPSPTVVPLTEEFLSTGESSGIDPDLEAYGSDNTFPEDPLLWSSIGWGWKEGKRYAHYSVSACPFDYKPSENRLTYYRNVELQVTLGETEPTLDEMNGEPTRDGTRAETKPQGVKEGTQLLVISYDNFQDELEPYVDWNNEKGTLTSIVPISTVDESYPTMDQASSIWQYIHDTYFGDDQKLEYVLLAGEVRYVKSRMAKDLDPYGPANEPDTLPADTYFACLDGTYQNWNSDRDNNWAELNDISDYVPDVYVSRISLDTESKATRWANLVVKYERDVEAGSWAGTVGMFGSSTHYPDDGPKQCEYLWREHLSGVYPTRERYYSDGTISSNTGANPLTYNSINNGFRDGLTLVVYMGHGYSQAWSEGTLDDNHLIYSVNEAGALSQSPRLPFISAMSCETNWFDASNFESISEGFTENSNGGAIAYVGASRTTEGGIGYDRYDPGAPGIQQDVLRMLEEGYRNTGSIFHEAKEHYVDSFSNYFTPSWEFAYNAYIEHNILGAPETPLWTDTPDTFKVSYSYDRDHYTNFSVQVKDSSNDPVEGAKVAVYSKMLGKLSTAVTTSNGVVKVPFEITETAYAKVTVTKQNFKPYQDELVIMDLTSPVTTLETSIPNPNGNNGWYTVDPGIGFSCSEPAEVYYKWNMGTVTTYKGGKLEIPEGDFLLEYWSADLSGNEEDRQTIEIKFDPNPPEAEIMLSPSEPDGPDDWYVTTPRVLTEIDPDGGSLQRVDYWFGKGSKAVSNGTIYIPEGDSELHVQAMDEAGNKGEELLFEFRVDTVKPATRLDTGGREPNERGWYTAPMTISLYCDDRYSDTYYSWDNKLDWERYSSEIAPLSGNHTLHYYSEDPHGNVEEVHTAIIAYDLMAPELEVMTEPRAPDGDNGWFVTRPKLLLSVFNEINGHKIHYSLNDGDTEVYTTPITLTDGEWTISCYAEDEAGNRGSTQTKEIKIDTQTDVAKVSIDLSADSSNWYTEMPGITLQTGENAQVMYSWDGSGSYQIYNGLILPPSEEGEFTLFYYSTDEAGNNEQVRQMQVNVDSKAPTTVVDAPASAKAGEKIVFDLSGSTDGIGVDSYKVDFGDGTDPVWSTEPNIEHVYSTGGTYDAVVVTRDAAGHESEPVELQMNIQDDSSGELLIIIAVAGIGLIIIAAAIGAAIVIRSRHHHHHYPHHAVGTMHHPNTHHVRPAPQMPPRNQTQLAAAQKQANLPPRKHVQGPAPNIPRPPAPPQLPKPPEPPVHM